MSEETKLTRALEAILEDNQPSDVATDTYRKTLFEITDAEKTPEVKKLESIVNGLSSKVAILTDQILQLNERIVSLMTLQEEFLYTMDQAETREDNTPQFTVDFEEKKFGLN